MSATSQVTAYNPDQIILIGYGVPISALGGYADGEFVSYEQTADEVMDECGTDGLVTVSRILDQRVTVKFSLMQSSTANTALSAAVTLARATPSGLFLPTSITDKAGSTMLQMASSWIKSRPKVSFDKSAKVREWTIGGVITLRIDGNN